MLPEATEEIVRMAFEEDLGNGDHTTQATIPADAAGGVHLLIRAPGVLAGVELAEFICSHVDKGLRMRTLIRDGAAVVKGDVAFTITGNIRSMLVAERVLLNFMQRMSGIASRTRQFVELLEGTKCKVLDTRKTTPNFRSMEKWAVRIGGGMNHRFGLYDMVLIKDNHVDFAGGIPQAILSARGYLKANKLALPVVIETRNMREVEQVLKHGEVDRIMLDNFTPAQVRKAVDRIDKRFPVEASGGITLKNARAYAEAGVDFISSGAIIHSATVLDMSLKAL
ncbi:MAG: carboxylating nicotinate-nucleotide diphosphorylase [Flavobacteriales bacterium]|nr:carboxylating nicotinate-nucleotide diphosphorylase [Flavobacteriales bacterium]